MKILVTGKNGQLGRSIHKLVNTDANIVSNQIFNDFIFVGREELDLSSETSIHQYFSNNNFDIIINCAAYTAVDKAEQEVELANQINHLAVKQLANIANKQKARLIHISTDFVFDGESDKPYTEIDVTNPINVYGQTKLAGEKALQAVMSVNAIIIRTSWLYSEYGNNFVSTILRLGKERDELSVISDQVGSPTYATDLASAILEIIKKKNFKNKVQASEIYHYSNKSNVSWYAFSKEILEIAKIECRVEPITADEYLTKAERPMYTVMTKIKIKDKFGVKVPEWKKSLKICINKIKL